MAFSRSTVVTLSSPFGPSSDKAGSKRIMHFVGLLWPLLTSRSAGRPNSAMPASPFQASGETSPGKNDDLPRTIAGSTPLPLGRRSFAVSGPLAPVRSASYPVPVRRLTGSFHASFSVRLTTNALRFPSVPATRFREDFHLQVIAHAGPTTPKGRARPCGRTLPSTSHEVRRLPASTYRSSKFSLCCRSQGYALVVFIHANGQDAAHVLFVPTYDGVVVIRAHRYLIGPNTITNRRAIRLIGFSDGLDVSSGS